jgi:hypothetical protein
METIWQDLRYATRSFARKPGYTLVIVLTLALGIGAVSAVFSFFNAALLRPLPYEQSERLAQLQSVESEKAGAYFSHPDFIPQGNAVAIINETLARRYFPDENPLGKRLAMTRDGAGWREIIGVAVDYCLRPSAFMA